MTITLNPAQTINSYLTDQYVWADSTGGVRSAALVRTNGKGGHAKQFTYTLPDGTVRTVNESPSAGGFGYIVSHLKDASIAEKHGQDDSPLGSSLDAQFRTVFIGDHHAIHEFTSNYPRWGRDPATGAETRYNMPVTIHWLFATSRDHPLWSVTFDLGQAPADAVNADTRAPYGDMVFDGAPAGTWGDELGGIAWGEIYQFATGGPPLTLSSSWDWSTPNPAAPYNVIWTRNTDAEMGIAGTQPIAKQDAGGYQGLAGRGFTSATAAYRCQAEGYTMPCTWGWPYQSVNWSFPDAVSPTNSKRLAWGADWGYLGQQTTTTINGTKVHGWPLVSYSTYIVLGLHSQTPTLEAARQADVIDTTTLTASIGTVTTDGPAGIGRRDSVTYDPTGYNPVYGTWEAQADNGDAMLTFTVPGDVPLKNPMLVLHGYPAPVNPAVITLDGLVLQSDVDVFVSYRADTQDLWLTLNRGLIGTQTISVVPAA